MREIHSESEFFEGKIYVPEAKHTAKSIFFYFDFYFPSQKKLCLYMDNNNKQISKYVWSKFFSFFYM